MTTIIYGTSDDNIEIDGDFYDEYSGDHADILIGIGNFQMKATIDYDGEWNIKVWGDDKGTEFAYTLYPAGHEEAIKITNRDFSDVLVINDPVSFVVVGMIARKKR